MPRHLRLFLLAASALIGILPATPYEVSAAPASTAPAAAALAGTWQVTQTCATGCYASPALTVIVKPFRARVWRASGGKSFLLYPSGKKRVLVFSAGSSAILTVITPGQLLRGPGVDKDGNTFTSTWTCTKAAMAASTGRLSPAVRDRTDPPGHRVFC